MSLLVCGALEVAQALNSCYMPNLHPRTSVSQESIFSRMSRLAMQYGAVNLGQGFPSNPPPDFLLEAARLALGQRDQYTPPAGLPELRTVLAQEYGVEAGQVVITAGATEALHALALCLYGPSDQVLMFEPVFDVYVPQTVVAGAEPILVAMNLAPAGWSIDWEAVEAAITPRCRALLINTPHNPTGYVFTQEDLQQVAQLARQHDLWIISDEVYSELYYAEAPASVWELAPERTFRVGSAGKRLEATGWRLGWIITPEGLGDKVAGIRQWASFCSASPLQQALAQALPLARQLDYYSGLRQGYRLRRDFLLEGLGGVGLEVYQPQGSYFVTARLPHFSAEELTQQARVTVIPGKAFYLQHQPPAGLIRLAFCKSMEELEMAVERLRKVVGG